MDPLTHANASNSRQVLPSDDSLPAVIQAWVQQHPTSIVTHLVIIIAICIVLNKIWKPLEALAYLIKSVFQKISSKTQKLRIYSPNIRETFHFTGREKNLLEIKKELWKQRRGNILLIHGGGGIGKSSIAREYARRNQDKYAIICWLNSDNETGIITGLLEVGQQLNLDIYQTKDKESALQVLQKIINFHQPSLFIFDNAEDETLLDTWIPQGKKSQTLITSQKFPWARPIASHISLDVLEEHEAITYILDSCERNDITTTDAQKIAQELGCLPLALVHASAYLKCTSMMTPAEYLEQIDRHLACAPNDISSPAIFATFRMAMEKVECKSPGSTAVLYFASLFGPGNISSIFFQQPKNLYIKTSSPVLSIIKPQKNLSPDLHSVISDKIRLKEVISNLEKYSLLVCTKSEKHWDISMHRLVQKTARNMLILSESPWTWIECIIKIYDSVFSTEIHSLDFIQKYIDHFQSSLDFIYQFFDKENYSSKKDKPYIDDLSHMLKALSDKLSPSFDILKNLRTSMRSMLNDQGSIWIPRRSPEASFCV